jgi:hypothetical protein
MISVPALFSASFCFPPHTLRLLANRRFTCMRAHILQLVSTASIAQGWAWLKKRLRVARNLVFARVPFFFVFVLLLFSPPAPFFGDSPGLPWALLGSPGLPWAPLGSSGCPWGVPGVSICDSPELPWAPLGSPGLPWAPLGSPRFPWMVGLTQTGAKLIKSGSNWHQKDPQMNGKTAGVTIHSTCNKPI